MMSLNMRATTRKRKRKNNNNNILFKFWHVLV
jgi:hypothetical protein